MSSIRKAKQQILLKNNDIIQTQQQHHYQPTPVSKYKQKINLHASQTLPGRGLTHKIRMIENDDFYDKSQGYSQDVQQQQVQIGSKSGAQKSFKNNGMKKKFQIQHFHKVTDKNIPNYKSYQTQYEKPLKQKSLSQQKRNNLNRQIISKSPQPMKKKPYSPSPQFAKTQRNDSKPHFHQYKDNQSENNSQLSGFSNILANKKQRRKTILGPGTYDVQNGPQRQNPFQKSNLVNNKNPQYQSQVDFTRFKTDDFYLAPKDHQQLSFTQKQPSVAHNSPKKSNFTISRKTVHQFDKLPLLISLPPSRTCHSPVKSKQCLNQKIQLQITQQKQKTHPYYDDIFPPRLSIIFTRRIFYQQEGLSFQRLTQIYQNQNISILQFSEPSFLVQGKFSSPAVYSALTILCADPMRVANLFSHQTFTNHGIYYVYLCKQGVWRYITIDDFMPIKTLQNGQKSLLFLNSITKNNKNQIWPCLVQKALAKIYGSYQDLKKSTKNDGIKNLMKILTGFPCSQYQINKDFRSYLIIIDAALKKNHIAVLEKIPLELRQTAILQQINPQYSYQIIEVKKNYLTIRDFSQQSLQTKFTFEEVLIFSKLLIFRNQNSSSIKESLKRQDSHQPMSKSPSKSSIGLHGPTDTLSNSHEKSYHYWSYTLRHKKKYYSILKIFLNEDSRCYWDIWQTNPANFKKNLVIKQPQKYSQSLYQIKIIPFGQNANLNFESNQSSGDCYIIGSKDAGKQIELKKGYYLLHIHLCQRFQRDFTISYYGKSLIDDQKTEKIKNKNQFWQGNSAGYENQGLFCFCQDYQNRSSQ